MATRFHVVCDDCGSDRVQKRPDHRCRGRHPADCAHCARVRSAAREFRLARADAEAQREQATYGYATEMAEFGPLVTYRDWLQQTVGATASGSGFEREDELCVSF